MPPAAAPMSTSSGLSAEADLGESFSVTRPSVRALVRPPYNRSRAWLWPLVPSCRTTDGRPRPHFSDRPLRDLQKHSETVTGGAEVVQRVLAVGATGLFRAFQERAAPQYHERQGWLIRPGR